jgi:hypothetical protein
MTDDTRGVDAEVVHQEADAIGVRWSRERGELRPVAFAEAEQIDDDNTVAFGHFAGDISPEVRRRGKPVQENDRLTRAARARGVVVESRDPEIHKLAAHRGKMSVVRWCDKREPSAISREPRCWRLAGVPTGVDQGAKNRQFALAFRHENGILSVGRRNTRQKRQIVLFDNDLANSEPGVST